MILVNVNVNFSNIENNSRLIDDCLNKTALAKEIKEFFTSYDHICFVDDMSMITVMNTIYVVNRDLYILYSGWTRYYPLLIGKMFEPKTTTLSEIWPDKLFDSQILQSVRLTPTSNGKIVRSGNDVKSKYVNDDPLIRDLSNAINARRVSLEDSGINFN